MDPLLDFSSEAWYHYLADWQRQLVSVTEKLVTQHQAKKDYLVDYSFLVFPISKAYEGFLKKFLFDLKLIDQHTYEGRRFRIGRALNPDVVFSQRDEYWLYDEVAQVCSPQIASKLWDAWLHCRNRVFHYFPKEKSLITFQQALEKIEKLSKAMRSAVSCYQQLEKSMSRNDSV